MILLVLRKASYLSDKRRRSVTLRRLSVKFYLEPMFLPLTQSLPVSPEDVERASVEGWDVSYGTGNSRLTRQSCTPKRGGLKGQN